MIGPIETWILISVFSNHGVVEGIKFKTETECLVHKYYLMELWEQDKLDKFVYLMECKDDTRTKA